VDQYCAEKVKWLEKNQIDVQKYPISFNLNWKGWKLVNEKPLVITNPFTNMDRYIRDAKDFQYKMVSRAGSKLLSEYLFMFATEEGEPGIPFFMLSKDEIRKVYKSFAERVDIDFPSSSIIFSLDDGIRYRMYHYEIEKRKNNADTNLKDEMVSAYLKELLPKSIHYGNFDPDPLITTKNGRARLVVSQNIPRWYEKSLQG